MELSSSSVQGVRDDLNKELRDFESTAVSTDTSKTENGDGVSLDPLAHLPEHFRKEIEAQSIVSSRKVSFKVCRISILYSDDSNNRNYFVSLLVRNCF
jgi:hypothetical protein